MRRLLIRVFFTLLSMCASKSSSVNDESTSKRDISLHTIHLATGSGGHGEGGYESGSTSPEVGGGSGSSNPSSTAIIPVITGGAANRNHHGRHHSKAIRIRSCPGFQSLVTMMLALCCILYKQDLVPDMSSGLDEYFIGTEF